MDDFNKLLKAVEKGREEVVKLLDSGVDIDVRNQDGNTVLISAAEGENLNLVKLLLNLGANVNLKNHVGCTSLYFGVTNGNKELIRLLLQRGAEIEKCRIKCYVHGPESESARDVYSKFQNAAVSFKTKICKTPVCVAINRGNTEVLQLLLFRASQEVIDTHFDQAIRSKNVSIVETFLNRGATVIDNLHEPNSKQTYLLSGIRTGNAEIVRLLLGNGASTSIRDKNTNSVLHIAAKGGNKDIVVSLLNHGASIDTKNFKNETVLHAAAAGPNPDIFKLFMDMGFEIVETNKLKETMLHIAAKHGSKDIVKLLLDSGVNVNAKDINGETALHATMWSIVGRSPDHIDKSLRKTNETSVLKSITFSFGPSGPVSFDTDQWTNFCTEDYLKIIEMLLIYGADVNLENKRKYKPHRIAIQNNPAHQVVRLLLSNSTDFIIIPDVITIKFANLNYGSQSEMSKTLISHAIKLESQGIALSEEALREICNNNSNFRKQCEEEIAKLKDHKDEDMTVSFYYFWTTTNLNQLAALTRNENVVGTLLSDDFKSSFPIYASSFYDQLRKGMWRRRMMDRVSVFFTAFTEEEGNESIPKLPLSCVKLILEMLGNRDLRVLISICNPRNGFDVEIDSLL